MRNVQCAMCSVQCTVRSVQCVRRASSSVQWTEKSAPQRAGLGLGLGLDLDYLAGWQVPARCRNGIPERGALLTPAALRCPRLLPDGQWREAIEALTVPAPGRMER